MSAVIKISITEEETDVTIEGNGKVCLMLLVQLFNTNPDVKKIFKDALYVEQRFALESEIENEINK